jgi:hypothetical protein
MTVVYYRGPAAYITEDVLEVWAPEHRVFRLSELTAVCVVPGVTRRTPAPVLSAVAVLVAVLLPIAHPPPAVPAVVLLFAAASSITAACLRSAPVPYELYGTHRGQRVRLFQCPDSQTLGQVRRALARAIEQNLDR